jgi:hypothetical protein
MFTAVGAIRTCNDPIPAADGLTTRQDVNLANTTEEENIMGWSFGDDSKERVIEKACRGFKTTVTVEDASGAKTLVDAHVSVMAHSVVGSNLWLAVGVHRIDDGSILESYVALYMIAYDRHDKSWGYKAIDEYCGPNEVDCPIGLLKMTAPHRKPDICSTNWRQAVMDHHQRRAHRVQATRGIRKDDIIQSRPGLLEPYTHEPLPTEWRVVEVLNKGVGRFSKRKGYLVTSRDGYVIRLRNCHVIGKLPCFSGDAQRDNVTSKPENRPSDPVLGAIHDEIETILKEESPA